MRTILILLLVILYSTLFAQIPAFHGAEGGGAVSLGGRGGRIIEVTNLNDSGAGSFRAACEASGPRTVVFKVAGIIDLSDLIYIDNPYLTVAGQSAPGGGITLRGKNLPANRGTLLYIVASNVVIRYIRLRHGYNAGLGNLQGKNIVLADGAESVIIDHCSLSWAQDKNLSIWGYDENVPIKNITIQNCIISEPIIDEYGHATGMLTGGGGDAIAKGQTNLDSHHNFFFSNRHRTPLFKGGSGQIVNNIIYHFQNYSIGWEGGATIDIVGNLIKNGPNPSPNIEIAYRDDPDYAAIGNPSIFIEGNKGPTNTNPANDNWGMIRKRTTWQTPGAVMDVALRRYNKLTSAYPITVYPVSVLENELFSHVGASNRCDENGAWVNNRDAVDVRQINSYKNGGGVFLSDVNNGETEVGGYPVIAVGIPYLDTDKDGMADAWEIKHCFNPKDPVDGYKDWDEDGYTNVEEFLNGTSPSTCLITEAKTEIGNDVIVEIYPNPAKTELHISGAISENSPYEIISIDGKTLQKGVLNGRSINIENLKSGIYLFKLKDDSGESVQKFVKE